MRARVPVIAFRLLVLVGVWFLGTSTLSLAQESSPSVAASTTATGQAATDGASDGTLLVPDVRNLPYVFAKGVLEDVGFAWRVEGAVDGYAVDLVAEQSAKPGTLVVDNGTPTIVLRLKTNPDYAEAGLPDNASPYPGTKLVLASGDQPKPASASDGSQSAGTTGDPTQTQTTATTPTQTDTAPTQTDTAPTQTDTQTQTTSVTPLGQTTGQPSSSAPDTSTSSAGSSASPRSPAFEVTGAPKEPLDEIPLTTRALKLEAWLAAQTTMTAASLRRYDYQHAWIVTGAKFGWWHGVQALQILLRVDQKLQERFQVGPNYVAETRAAITEVGQKTNGQ